MPSNEIWKDIEGYEELYQVSNFGNVKNLRTNKILKDYINYGYKNVILCKNGKTKCYKVHRLVAQAFVFNLNNLPCVNHKDENRINNNANNLEWCSWKYNNNYGNRNKKISDKLGKKVIQYSLKGYKIKEWKSISEAERVLKIPNSNIVKCCKKERNRAGGYIWKYE